MSNNPRVALYTDDPDEGGVAVYTNALACGLVKRGYKTAVVQSKSENALIEQQRKLGVDHHWLPYNTRKDFLRTLKNEKDAEEAFAATKPNIVLFANCDPFSHIAAKTVAVKRGIPFVVVENYVWPAPRIPQKIAAYMPALENHYQCARAVVAVSKDNLDILHRDFKLPAYKGQVIHYGRPESFFTPRSQEVRDRLRKEFKIPRDAVVCLTVGRLEAVKGHQILLDGLRTLMDKPVWSNLYFVWLGGGSLQTKLKTSIEELGISERVKMLGQRWDVLDWLDASDLFILPSLCEGMPLSIMEAMAKSLPVMASAVSGTPEELGNTGKLLPSPNGDTEATSTEIASTLEQWAGNAQLRASLGAAGKARAMSLFREDRMVDETRDVIERASLPAGDYVSPGLSIVRPDASFPNMVVGNTANCDYAYLRRDVPHNWYVDKRSPTVGFVNRDEASILYNTALRFKGKRCLEIGCWLGWSACHLALGGVILDVIDPMIGNPEFLESIRSCLKAAGVLDSINLIAGTSPQEVDNLGWNQGRKWSLFFIDGDHGGSAPVNDAAVCTQFAEDDSMMLFHDLLAPEVARGLEYLKYRGWNTMVYSTMQIMGVAWRGAVTPVPHRPDPSVNLPIPPHLLSFPVSGR